MRHRSAPSDPDPLAGWTYSETIDEGSSAIRVHGRVDRLGVDLLRGTIEELERRGHMDITVTIDDHVEVDPGSRAVLAQIAGQLADRHGRLRITCAEGDGHTRHRRDAIAEGHTAP
jgi:hypothetical protein